MVAASYLSHEQQVVWNVKLDRQGELTLTLVLFVSDDELGTKQKSSLPQEKPKKYKPPPPSPPAHNCSKEVDSLQLEVLQLRSELKKMRDQAKEDQITIKVLQAEKAAMEYQLQATQQQLMHMKNQN